MDQSLFTWRNTLLVAALILILTGCGKPRLAEQLANANANLNPVPDVTDPDSAPPPIVVPEPPASVPPMVVPPPSSIVFPNPPPTTPVGAPPDLQVEILSSNPSLPVDPLGRPNGEIGTTFELRASSSNAENVTVYSTPGNAFAYQWQTPVGSSAIARGTFAVTGSVKLTVQAMRQGKAANYEINVNVEAKPPEVVSVATHRPSPQDVQSVFNLYVKPNAICYIPVIYGRKPINGTVYEFITSNPPYATFNAREIKGYACPADGGIGKKIYLHRQTTNGFFWTRDTAALKNGNWRITGPFAGLLFNSAP